MTTITELNKERLNNFFQYLARHISENGLNGTAPFVPLTRRQSELSDELKLKFEDGLEKEFGEKGWRKTWVAINEENNIVGHADIRSINQLNAEHRVVLGMGVDKNYRRQRIGFNLLLEIINYCKANPGISWLDLEVISSNTKAKSLYEKTGFRQVGLTEDMFRIDHISYDYIRMTLNVEN